MRPLRDHLAITVSLLALIIAGCVGNSTSSVAPANPTIVGNWRFAKAGEHTISFPFLMDFRSDGTCNSGPTPTALVQRSTYTFDGSTIVMTYEGKPLVIKNVHVEGTKMTFPAEDGGQPILLTYQRVWPP